MQCIWKKNSGTIYHDKQNNLQVSCSQTNPRLHDRRVWSTDIMLFVPTYQIGSSKVMWRFYYANVLSRHNLFFFVQEQFAMCMQS